MMKFTDADLDLLAHCLSIASDTFLEAAYKSDAVNQPRLGEQFRYQATEARELQTRIDNRE